MKKIILLILICLGKLGFSQSISAPTASYSLSTAYTNGSSNDRIFGFCTPNAAGVAVTGALTATAGVANCTFIWTVFNAATNSYTAFTTQTGLMASTITGLGSGGYHVTIKNSAGTVLACDLAWVWVNQTAATVSPIAAGCSPFSLNGTASAVSNFTYYNPPPEPFLISSTTSVTVCFKANHTYVSDLGFYLIGPAACGSPIVTLSPNPGSNGQGSICNSGNNVNNLCFTTIASPNFNPCSAATPYTGTYDSYGPAPGTNINWSPIYGCDANSGGWKVQIFDCIGSDVGALTNASVSFSGNSGCGPSVVNYNSGTINSAINDNSCNSASASIYTVPATPATSPIVINNSITYQWTSVPASTIPNSNSSLTPSINPNPTVDTWYYLTVTDNFGCAKKDSAFFDYSPPGTPTITPAGPFCANAAATNLSASPAGGSWTGTGITNATNGTFNPAAAGPGTFTVTYTTPGVCGASRTISVIVNPVPTVSVPASPTVCNGAAVPAASFTANPAGSVISWTNNNTAIGLGASGTGNIPSFTGINNTTAPITAVVTVTASLSGCSGTPVSYTITVNPTPVLNTVPNQTVCNTANTSAINFVSSPPGATVNWTNTNGSIGIGTSGNGNIPSFAGTNTTSSTVAGNFSAIPTLAGCTGTAIAFVIAVDPTPVLNAIASQTLCAGALANAVNFSTTPAGAAVSWTNSNPGIGIGASGNGNIASFPATNSTSAQISGNFSVVPTLNTCVGAPKTFTITVNPTPVLTAVTSQTICEGLSTAAINYVTNPSGSTINWSNTNTATGLAASGTGNIPSFTGLTSGTPAVSVVTATPTLNSCVGTPVTFTIEVDPTPVLSSVASQTVCEGLPITAVNFSVTPAGAIINWTNSSTAIGLPSTGTGNIASYNAANGTGAIVNAAFTATPSVGTCTGSAVNFTITVKPAVTLSSVASQTICESLSTAAINFVTNPSGSTVNWSNTNTATGLAASGTGNIPSFTGLTSGTPAVSVVTATPTLNSCVGTPVTFTIEVDPTPVLSSVASQTVCEGLPITAVNFSVTPAGAIINWNNSSTAIGLPSTGTGNIASYNAANGTGSIVNAAFTATPSVGTCTGSAVNFTITVKPAVTLSSVASQTICEGLSTAAINFVTNPSGSTINWSNTNTATGLAASGTGNIPSFTGLNGGASPLSSIVTATPTLNSCVGTPVTFTIEVDPTPVLSSVASQTVCEGLPITAVNFSVTPAGAIINWNNSSTAIGLPSTGTGNIASYNAANGTGAIVNAAFTATPSIGTCTNSPVDFTITVNPAVTANAITSTSLCNGATAAGSSFSSNPPGAVFSWTNSDNTIGLASTGNGNYSSFTASNLTANPVTAIISVTPSLNGCVGTPATYSITVNPTPAPPTVSNTAYCLNYAATPLTATSSANGSLNWWGTNAAGGTSSTSAPTPVTTATGTTNYYVSQTVYGCESPRAQIQVTVSSLPAVIDPPDLIFCSGDVVPLQTFTVNPSIASTSWVNTITSIGLGGTGTGAINSFTASNTGATPVTSEIFVTPSIGSCVGATISFSITVNPLPTVAVNNSAICNTKLTPQINWTSNPAGASFTWTNSTTSIGLGASGTTNIPSFNAINNGSIPVNATITVSPVLNGCTGPSSSFTITVNPTPLAPAATTTSYCVNAAAAPLTATGSGLLWYTSATGGNGSASAPVPSTANAGTVSSFVSQTVLGCESPRTQIITSVSALPTANLFPVAASCPPLCTHLSISSPATLTSYSWNLGDGSSSTGNDTIFNHCYNTSGLYTISVTITDNNSCVSTVTFSNAVHVYDVPKALFDFGPQPATLIDPTITFTSTSIGTQPLQNNWYFGDGTGIAINENAPEYTYQSAGSYIVQLTTTNSFGCKDIIEATVIIENDFSLYIPNAFSPNKDGLNDVFGPVGIGIDTQEYEFYIFDRWGTMLFFSNDMTKGWNGKAKGTDDLVPLDTYVWKLECKSLSGQIISKAGHVTLLK